MITKKDIKEKMRRLAKKYPKYEMYMHDLTNTFIHMLAAAETDEKIYQFNCGASTGEMHFLNLMLIGESNTVYEEISKATNEIWDAIVNQHYEAQEE